MKYDFSTFRGDDRRKFHSLKWNPPGDNDKNVVPMWVADMDCTSPAPISEAIKKRTDHGVYGYELPSPKLRKVVVDWLKSRYEWTVRPEHIVFLPGLVSGLNLVCRAFGKAGTDAVILTPVYPPFRRAPRNNGMFAREVKLSKITTGGDLTYVVDFDELQNAITPDAKVLILSHPHNPIGREFTTGEMQRLGEICVERNLVLCSDEIHCDLRLDEKKHVPFATLNEEVAARTITLMSPSKTFNLSGLGCGFAVVPNERRRKQLMDAGYITEADSDIVPHVNALALAAVEAAYSDKRCLHWLKALQIHLSKNCDRMLAFLKKHMSEVKATVPTATYLGWFDCGAIDFEALGHPTAFDFFLQKANVRLSKGEHFGPGGERCVRFNFGCPESQMDSALNQMSGALRSLRRGK